MRKAKPAATTKTHKSNQNCCPCLSYSSDSECSGCSSDEGETVTTACVSAEHDDTSSVVTDATDQHAHDMSIGTLSDGRLKGSRSNIEIGQLSSSNAMDINVSVTESSSSTEKLKDIKPLDNRICSKFSAHMCARLAAALLRLTAYAHIRARVEHCARRMPHSHVYTAMRTAMR